MLPLLFFLLFTPAPGRAAFELDGLETSLPLADPHQLGANPTALGYLPCFTWQLVHHLPFGLRELRYHQIGLGFPTKWAGISLNFSSSGFALHREQRLRLSAGMARGSSLGLGAGLSLLNLEQRGTRPRRYLTPTAGLLFNPTPNLQVGAWWQKSMSISSSRLFVSLTHRLDAHSVLHLHGRRHPTRPTRFDLAVAHRLHPHLNVHLGLRSLPRRFALGTDLTTPHLRLNYTIITHAYLGPSHTFHLRNPCRSP